MSYLDAYRERVSPNGASMKDAIQNTSKRQAINYIMDSPTLTHIRLNYNVDSTPVIASDKEMFHKRTYLFLPDTKVNVGDYIHQTDNTTYLAVDQKKDDIYPQLIAELCNETFLFVTEGVRTIIGYDDFKRPIYRQVGAKMLNIPCVMTTKVPSMIDNSAIPLPEGAMIVKIPYVVDQIPPVNYVFKYQDKLNYKVTNISYENVINGVGYVEMRLQRGTGES